MAENSRGARRKYDHKGSPMMQLNPRREYHIARMIEWADHAQAQYFGPYPGETDEEREASRQACLAVAYNSKEMALLHARVAELLPAEIPVVEDESTPTHTDGTGIVS